MAYRSASLITALSHGRFWTVIRDLLVRGEARADLLLQPFQLVGVLEEEIDGREKHVGHGLGVSNDQVHALGDQEVDVGDFLIAPDESRHVVLVLELVSVLDALSHVLGVLLLELGSHCCEPRQQDHHDEGVENREAD